MSFYILLFCAVICSPCCVSFARQKESRLIAKFLTINIMFVPAAIRYGIGVDYNNYVYIFNKSVAQSIIILNRIRREILFLFAPMAYETFIEEDNRQIRSLIVSGCVFLLFFFDLINRFHGSIPYKTIFTNF